MSESIWKKEIHLRKPKAPKVDEIAAPQAAKGESVWRKERHVRRQPEPLPPLPQHLLDSRGSSAGEAVPERGSVIVPVVPGRASAAQRFAQEFDAWAHRAVEPSLEEQPSLDSSQDEVTLTELDAVPVIQMEAAAAIVEPEPLEVETPPALMELGSAAVPELELPSEPNQVPEFPAQQEKVPLLKREIHFRKPKAAKPPKAKKEPKPAKEQEEKSPLLKREIHFRKPKAVPELHPEPAQELEVEVTPAASATPPPVPKEKAPLLKREINFRRPKTEQAAKQKAPKSDGNHKVTRVVGLRIGSSQISAAHVRNNGSAELVQLAQMPIDRGLVVGGEVRDADGLTRALKEFFAKQKLPRKDVRLGVASNRIGVRVLEVPNLDDAKQFKNALRFRAQELLPIPVVDAILDYAVIDSFTDDEGTDMRRVLLVFAHRELVSRFVDVCRGAGIRLSGIDLEPFALLRSVAPPRGESGDAIVAVAVGQERTIVAVSDGRICDFVRVLDWGSGALDVAIARALDLAPSQAEPLKRELALDAAEPPEGVTPVQLELVKTAARAEIAALGRELVSSLRFYQSREGSLAIGEVLLTGGGAQFSGLGEELQRHIGAPIRLADPFARLELPRKFKRPESAGSLAVAVGLGIED